MLKKYKNKFDCLVYEMLFIRSLKPNLNMQADSIRVKAFYNLFKNFLQSSHPLMLILGAKTALNVAICMIFFNIFLDNGVMNTPKRRILSLVFTVLCFNINSVLKYST